jgi:acetyltransferase-like isoleucine patch superfamily enzyme
MLSLRKLLREYKKLLYNRKGIWLLSSDFSIHRTAFFEVLDTSKVVLNAGFSACKFVVIFLTEGSLLEIGHRVYVGDYSTIRVTRTTVSIGDDTIIGQGVKILATNHNFLRKDLIVRQQDIDLNKIGIHIGKDCWLGAGSIILPGVTLGDGVVVGAGSIVTKSVPDYGVVAGNPARILKFRT